MSLGRLLVSENHFVGVGGGDDGHVDGVSDTKWRGNVTGVRLPRSFPLLTRGEHLPSFQWSGWRLFQANQVVELRV